MIKPTVGRMLWFHPAHGVTHAAQIAYVHSDVLVNLSVIDENGVQYNKTSVQLVQPNTSKPEFGAYCEWMPFQANQAPKPSEPVTFGLERSTADALVRIIHRIDAEINTLPT